MLEVLSAVGAPTVCLTSPHTPFLPPFFLSSLFYFSISLSLSCFPPDPLLSRLSLYIRTTLEFHGDIGLSLLHPLA